MKAWNVTEDQLHEAARDANPSPGTAKRSPTADTRRIADWHGHRDFFMEVYERAPEARIKTAMADCRGSEDFRKNPPPTMGANAWDT